MPTYDYHCNKCGHDFVRVEHIEEHEHAHPRCPECRSTRVERVLSPPMVKTSKKS